MQISQCQGQCQLNILGEAPASVASIVATPLHVVSIETPMFMDKMDIHFMNHMDSFLLQISTFF